MYSFKLWLGIFHMSKVIATVKMHLVVVRILP
nr:MAG TPA: hypothetical protein [Caudoviricetes sp.]DAU30723.1 MAG TPA: hypothetical protein [Bacteriophage sp.]